MTARSHAIVVLRVDLLVTAHKSFVFVFLVH